jgi:glutamate formiminotransferase
MSHEQIISVVVPNVCEGDEAFVEGPAGHARAVPGLVVLDVSMDQVRNRTIFSFTGSKEAIFEGGFLLYEAALAHIDMRQHQGEYPRIGAVDVFPFVPLQDAPLETAVDWSVEFAEEVARASSLPVYLFAESARRRCCAATSRASARASTRASRRR